MIETPKDWDRKDKDGSLIPFDPYVNLHVHSYYSLLDGMPSPQSIVDRTFELGQLGEAITDHGVMFSIPDHFLYAKKKNQHAIAGFEAYVVGNHKERTNEGDNARQHLLLLAKNQKGYEKLCYWCSMGCTKGFYYRPRIDDSIIESTGGQDIIAASACIAGRIPQFILNNELDKAREAILYYKNLFEEFYLEIQPMKDAQQVIINKQLIEFSRELNVPLVATSDSHYLKREDAITHDILLCMQSGKLLSDPNRWRFKGDTYFIASRKEMEQLFNEDGHEVLPKDAIEEALDNTVIIAQKCTFQLQTGVYYLPDVNIPISDTKFLNWHNKHKDVPIKKHYLRYLCIKGLKEKGLTDQVYKDRLDYELDIIDSMGFNDYFLIYYDIIKYCNENDIPVGPGRGCATKDNIVKLADGKTKFVQDVLFGDVVEGHDEKPHKVVNTFKYDCDETVTTLKTENNNSLTMTNDHRVYAIKEKDFINGCRQPQWYPMESLEQGDYLAELDE